MSSNRPQRRPYPGDYTVENLLLQSDTRKNIEGLVGFDSNRKIIEWDDGSGVEHPTFVHTNDVRTSTATVSNTTSETEVYRGDVNTGAMQQGRVFILRVFGKYSTASSNDDFTLRAYFGDSGFDPTAGEGTKIEEVTTVQENVTDGPWQTKITMTVASTGSSGTLFTHAEGAFNNTKKDNHGGSKTIDTTSAEEFVVTVQWNNAKADNSLNRGSAYLQQQA